MYNILQSPRICDKVDIRGQGLWGLIPIPILLMKLLLPSGNPEKDLLSKQLAVFKLNYIHICFKSVSVCWSKFCGKEIISMQYLMNYSTSEGSGSPTPYVGFETLSLGNCLWFYSSLSFPLFSVVGLLFGYSSLYFTLSCFTRSNSSVLDCRSLFFIKSSKSLVYPQYCMNWSFDLICFFYFTKWNFWRSSILQERNAWVTEMGFLIWP